MIIEQTFTVQAPIETLWAFMIDIEGLSTCIPGAEGVKTLGDDQFAGTLTVKVGPILASFAGQAQLLETEAPSRLVARGEATDPRSNSTAAATFTATLNPVTKGQTDVHYQIDVNIRGTLGRFGQGVIREVAKRMTDEFARCVEARLAGPPPAVPGLSQDVSPSRPAQTPASPAPSALPAALPPLDVGAAILPDYFPWLLVAGLTGFILGLIFGFKARR